MTAVSSSTPPAVDTEQEVLTCIARGGLLISATELRYQLNRHGRISPRSLTALLRDLQERGLIESQVHYRLTPAGAQCLPATDRPAPRTIGSIPWTSPPPSVPAARRQPAATPIPAAAARSAAPTRRTVRPRRSESTP